MALVPHGGRQAAALFTLGNAARFAYNAYRNRRFANNIANSLRGAYNMAKRHYSGGQGYSRSIKRRRLNPTYKGRKQYRGRGKGRYRFKKLRRRGRRTLKNRYMLLRNSQPLNFTWSVSSAGQFESAVADVSNGTDWIPREQDVNDLKVCMFNNCDSKKLVSVHVYLTDVQVVKYYTGAQDNEILSDALDSKFYTYADSHSAETSSWPSPLKYIQANGLASKFTRNMIKFHSILKHKTYCRATVSKSMDQLRAQTWTTISKSAELNMFNKTGTGLTNQPNSISYMFNLNDNFVAPKSGTQYTVILKANQVVATKWRLYGAKP